MSNYSQVRSQACLAEVALVGRTFIEGRLCKATVGCSRGIWKISSIVKDLTNISFKDKTHGESKPDKYFNTLRNNYTGLGEYLRRIPCCSLGLKSN